MDIRRTSPLVALLCTAGVLFACSKEGAATDTTPVGADAGSDASAAAAAPDASDASTADASSGADAIVAPADKWTWVDFPDSRCLHGGATGIAVNPHPGSTRLLLFLQGGGECTNCWGATPDAKVGTPTKYGPDELAAEPDIGNASGEGMLVVSRTDERNPFKDDNIVFVPYCTGDWHGGTATVTEGANTTYHWGAKDLEMFLARLKPTFPGLTRVTLAGTSAGGAGVTLSYARVRDAFGVRTDWLIDSAPPITGPADFTAAAAPIWGLFPIYGCPSCASASDVHEHNRSLDPASRFAFIGYRYDKVVGADMYGTDLDGYAKAVDDFAAKVASEPNGHTFLVDNTAATAKHVVMSGAGYRTPLGQWLGAMTKDDPSWSSEKTQ